MGRAQSNIEVEFPPHVMRTLAAAAAREVIEQLRRNPIVSPEWLSLQDAAVYTGYSEQQLSEFVRTNRAPKSIKFSHNARRFWRRDLDTWCAAGGPSQYQANSNTGHDTAPQS